MPNIELLREFDESLLLEAIKASNTMKQEREASKETVAVA